MNAETIDLLKKVQGRRGEWRVFDYCWHLKFKDGLGVVLGTGKNSVLSIYFRGMDHHSYCEPDDPDLLWLPPTAPGWNDDGRNLCSFMQEKAKKFDIHWNGENHTWYVIVGNHSYAGRPLPEALLRAAVGKGE